MRILYRDRNGELEAVWVEQGIMKARPDDECLWIMLSNRAVAEIPTTKPIDLLDHLFQVDQEQVDASEWQKEYFEEHFGE